MKNKNIYLTSFIALFGAIVCVGCFIKIPIGVIPIVLQNVLCILTGAIIGGIFGGAPTALFLIAGLIGLPVYSGGTSGVAVWMGPTGGFLPGYLIGAIVAGFIAGRPSVMEKKIKLENSFKGKSCNCSRYDYSLYSWCNSLCKMGNGSRKSSSRKISFGLYNGCLCYSLHSRRFVKNCNCSSCSLENQTGFGTIYIQ